MSIVIHPLFAAAVDNTDTRLFAARLGFESKYLLIDHHPSEPFPNPTGYEQDADQWIQEWQPECPEDFHLAAKWDTEDGPAAFFVKPTTKLATAFWLIGLGQMAHDEQPEPHYSYLDISDECEDFAYTGRFATAEEAINAANEKLSPGTPMEVGRFITPLASQFVDADTLIDSIREAADPLLPDEDWPALFTRDRDALHNSLKFLVDGWATHSENQPTFGIET